MVQFKQDWLQVQTQSRLQQKCTTALTYEWVSHVTTCCHHAVRQVGSVNLRSIRNSQTQNLASKFPSSSKSIKVTYGSVLKKLGFWFCLKIPTVFSYVEFSVLFPQVNCCGCRQHGCEVFKTLGSPSNTEVSTYLRDAM
jgi:hypothetical protein